MNLPYTVCTLTKNSRQRLRVEIVQPSDVPMIRLQQLEVSASGNLKSLPGSPAVPARLAGQVAAAFIEAERLIGGGQ